VEVKLSTNGNSYTAFATFKYNSQSLNMEINEGALKTREWKMQE